MNDTFNFNGSIGQFVKEGDGIIHDYHAQSMAASSTMQDGDKGKNSSSELTTDGTEAAQLSNRQVVIMMAGLLDLSLSPDFTNQKQLAQFLSRLTGRSETPQARKDSLLAADVLEPVCKKVASRLRNDAME